ncbi:MAG: HAD family hydrolase, partial [Oligoflexales bacterium]|nr:HAD family hydrolase [Oligoflexales bacterium]
MICRRLSVQPSDTVFLGDSSADMLTAKNAGMIAVGALWGFRTRGELVDSGADVLLERPVDLLKFIS